MVNGLNSQGEAGWYSLWVEGPAHLSHCGLIHPNLLKYYSHLRIYHPISSLSTVFSQHSSQKDHCQIVVKCNATHTSLPL